ncbi:MAG: hypothetical protein NPIRA04_23320 [Nitrospirales bacterium]|nr:MAG: hypothetical protein NPIRA04_23320 [Nitrospirales bacterium]
MKRNQALKGIMGFLVIVGLASLVGFGLATTPGTPLDPTPEQIENEWSAEEHLIAANLFEETAVRLEAKVGHLKQRIARFAKKPYLDPKGFKRQGWKLLMGSHRAELKELREQIAWHHEQAKQLNAMSVTEDKKENGKS